MEQNCSICFKFADNLIKITETDGNNRQLVCKLKSCVSEIDWKDDYLICNVCNADLDVVYEFRTRCLNAENLRKQRIEVVQLENIKIDPEIKPKKSLQFQCEICPDSFKTSTQLITHSIKEHKTEAKSIKPFVCDICNSKFGRSSNLIQHLKYHYGDRTHVCTYCGKSYVTKSDLTIHEKTHLNKRDYKCEECPKSFNTHKDLRTHKWVVHTDPDKWQHVCEICEKKFPVKSNYDAHMRRHKNERPFSCDLCDKKFIDKCVLRKHYKAHSNIRAFICDICKKEYKDKRVMEIHKAKIHGVGDIKVPVREKKYFCHVCPKSYFEKNKLTHHLCSHTGEKPYLCSICQKKFADKSYVKRHMKTAHNVTENDSN